jgi:hypothetical protein
MLPGNRDSTIRFESYLKNMRRRTNRTAAYFNDFLLDEQDRIYRFLLSRFVTMLGDPVANPYPQFAPKRVRGTQVFVELAGSRL